MSRPIQLKQSFDVPVRETACPLITRHCVRGYEILFSHTSTRCKNCIGYDLYSGGIWFESLPGTRYAVGDCRVFSQFLQIESRNMGHDRFHCASNNPPLILVLSEMYQGNKN
jgi:hypothetical protein